jgi:hypothetical protein
MDVRQLLRMDAEVSGAVYVLWDYLRFRHLNCPAESRSQEYFNSRRV